MSIEEPDYDVKKLERLLDLMADDMLEDEDVEELQEILLKSEQARQKYINFNFVDDSLHWSYAEAALDKKRDNDYFKNTVQDIKEKDKNPVPFNWLAIAAILAIALTVSLSWNSVQNKNSESIATVIESNDTQWAKPMKSEIVPGIFSLEKGSAKIVFKSGAEMTLTAPVEVDIKAHLHARLLRGKVKLYAPKSAIGFRLETEATNFVDIGTEFEVSVDKDNNSEIHVLDGVVVARSKYSDAVVPFGKNEAGRVDSEHGVIIPVEKEQRLNPLLQAKGINKPVLDKNSRVVFLGERNTDYETYLHMVNQAIYDDTPENAPTLINAGLTYLLGSDDGSYEEYIRKMKPTHAFLALASARPSFNIDHNPLWFESALNKLCDKLEGDKIKPIIQIGFPMSDEDHIVQRFNNYKRILLKVAEKRAYPVARADTIWETYRQQGKTHLLSQAKGIRLTYTGQQVFARSVLDIFGYNGLEVPFKLRLKPLPGILEEWLWTEYETPEKLSPELISKLDTSGWQPLSLPMPMDKGHTSRFVSPYMMYEYQAKSLGFGLEISGVYSNTIRAVSHFNAAGGMKFLNIGGGVKEIWLNGELIKDGLTNMFKDGRHPGGRRFKVNLKPGKNTIVLDCTMNFFVSLTDDGLWGLQPPVKKAD